MVKLPDPADMRVALPSAGRQNIVSYQGGEIAANTMIRSGQQLAGLGEQVGRIAERERQETDRLRKARALLDYEKAAMDKMQAYSQSPDKWQTFEPDFAKWDGEVRGKILSGFHGRDAELMGMELEERAMRGLQAVRNERDKFARQGALVQAQDDADFLSRKVLSGADVGSINKDLYVVAQQIDSNPYIDPAEKDRLRRSIATNVQSQIVDRDFKADPIGTLKRVQGATKGGAEAILARELGAGGKIYEHSDGDGMAIAGINSEAYPQQFAEIKQILQTQGDDAAKKYALDFYQKEFVSNPKVANLAPEVQDVVADGLVNHWSGFQRDLLAAANAGASRQELIDMRRAEYARLTRANPEKYGKNADGWERRLQVLEQSQPSPYSSFAPDVLAKGLEIGAAMSAAELKNDLRSVQAAQRMNILTPTEKFEQMKLLAQSSGNSDLFDEISKVEKNQAVVADFVRLPIAKMDEDLRREREHLNTTDETSVARFALKTEAMQNKAKALKDDPRAYFEAQEIIPQTTKSVFDADGGVYEIENRRAQAKIVKDAEGIAIPLLTKTEIDQLKQLKDSGNTQQLVQAINILQSSGVNPTTKDGADELRAIASQVVKNDFTLAVAMTEQNPDVRNAILVGDMIKESPTSFKEFSDVAATQVGTAFFNEKIKQDYLQAAYAFYKQANAEEASKGSPSADGVKGAIDAVIGNVADVNIHGMASSVVLPDNIDRFEFEDRINSIDDGYIKNNFGNIYYRVAGGMRPLTAQELFATSKLKSAGYGRYVFANQSGNIVVNEKGIPVEIDVFALGARPVTRMPNALLGFRTGGM